MGEDIMTKLQCYQHGITIIIVQLYKVYQFYIISWTVAVLYNIRYKISFDSLKDTGDGKKPQFKYMII